MLLTMASMSRSCAIACTLAASLVAAAPRGKSGTLQAGQFKLTDKLVFCHFMVFWLLILLLVSRCSKLITAFYLGWSH